MDRSPLALSPLAVLAGGVAALGICLMTLRLWMGLQPDQFWFAAIAGLSGVIGAATVALGHWFAQRKAARVLHQAQHDAKHDALTGLANRAELFRQLSESLESAAADDTTVGVLFLDLDGFKFINDSLGHEAGDELLKVVADRLQATIRTSDLVARLGGDEFVVICRDLRSSDSVISVAKQILRSFDEPVSLNGSIQRVGTSIGVAVAEPGDGRRADDLLRDADAAMYGAKRGNGGYVVYDDAHRSRLEDRANLEIELVRAVAQGEFLVFYQPIVDVERRELMGFEALVRWVHPEKGLLEPGDFLAVAEEAGLMTRIGRTVLREACAQVAIWNHNAELTSQVTVSVNLSEEELLDPTLTSQVEDVLLWAGMAPAQLVLEVSEQMLADNIDDLEGLRQVRNLGVAVAVDGYGTGHLSFGHMRTFDMVSTMKIDRSFVRGVVWDPTCASTIRAMVSVAGALGVSVVAEGVEKPEQLEALREMGVRFMQGYLFQEPGYAEVVDPGAWFDASGSPLAEPGLRPAVAVEAR